jgi:hypothetical protein
MHVGGAGERHARQIRRCSWPSRSCGVPAGVDAFRVAREVFAEIGKK